MKIRNLSTITQVITLQNTSKQRYELLQDDYLSDKAIKGISIRRQDSGGNKVAVDGADLVTDLVLGASFLTLQSDGFNFLDRCPLDYLAINTDSESIEQRYFELDLPNGFNPTKSFITIAETTNLVTGSVFEITFFYEPGAEMIG